MEPARRDKSQHSNDGPFNSEVQRGDFWPKPESGAKQEGDPKAAPETGHVTAAPHVFSEISGAQTWAGFPDPIDGRPP
jgi:hypothetical protein